MACTYIKSLQPCVEREHYRLMSRRTTPEGCWQEKNLKHKKNIKKVKIQRRVQVKGVFCF